MCNKETFVFIELSQRELQSDLFNLKRQQTSHGVSLKFIIYDLPGKLKNRGSFSTRHPIRFT